MTEDRSRALRLHRELAAIWRTPPGIARLSAVNHTEVGKRFIITALVFFAIGGLLAMLIRIQLATSQTAFVGPELYSQIFTMHGTVMMFLFAIPMFEGLAMYLLPKMLGSRDMAFPRLSAYGYWCYLFGGAILIVAMLAGLAPSSGWFMYTPLSSATYSPGIQSDIWLLGVTFVEISALSAAIEIIVTVLRVRAPGMSLDRMPILAWYLLITAFMMLFGFPPLILGSILLELERAFGLPFFDPSRGGDSLLWQHLFWLFGHPEVYIIFLPAAGMVSTILPTLARHPLVGYRSVIVAVTAVAFLSFGLWVHHMYAVGIPHLALAFFSAASGLVAVPTAVQIFAWIATLAEGRRPKITVPLLYLGGFLFIFVLGGLSGVMVAMVPFNWQAHDSHFIVAHLHYVLVGGFVFPMLAAAYYWLPHFTGRTSVSWLSFPAFWFIFIGFNITFFGMHLTGLRGMPRRVDAYPVEAGWDWLNLVSSIGGFVMAAGFALFVIDLLVQVRFGTGFRRNPWGAGTAEWAMPTPPTPYAFASLPRITGRADRLDVDRLAGELAAGKGYLGFTRNGWMETIGVDIADGAPSDVIVLPRQSYKPLLSGLATAAMVLCLLFKLYVLAILAFAVTVASLFAWTAGIGTKRDLAALPIDREGTLRPVHWQVRRPPSWWAMTFAIAADATALACLLFGGFFLWLVAPAWPPPVIASPMIAASIVVLALVMVAGVAGRIAAVRIRPGGWTAAALVAQIAATAGFAWMAANIEAPTGHAQAAVQLVLLAYAGLRSGLGALLAGYCLWRIRAGFVSMTRRLDLRIAGLWHGYAAGSGALVLAAAQVLAGFATMPGGPS